MTDGVSLADIAAVTDNNKDGMFGGAGGCGMWIFAFLILLLLGGGDGLFGANKNGTPVTEAGLCNAMNFNDLQNSVGRLSDQNQNQTMQISSNISALGKEVALGQVNLAQQINAGDATLAQQIANCSYTTQRAIDGVNYNGAINTAAINANTTAQTQKVLDAIQQNKIDTLQAQVNQLQLQSAMCGVVRYPNASTYTAGFGPFYNQSCCNNTCNI